ncbi:MAG: chromosome partitioning protein ParB [Rhodospirillales bacterium]|nr:chromosome partitioning protein ParB [Rhodospirillales bacterium]
MLLMKSVAVPIDEIYIPMKLRKAFNADKVQELAESILERGLITPIQVRRDDARYVLVTGLHRLEAARVLGEKTIDALIVQARSH